MLTLGKYQINLRFHSLNRTFTAMRQILTLLLTGFFCAASAQAPLRRWTVADGLPTGEVHQIIELPNGQILVNCEGVFCISNGKGFQTVACDQGSTYQLPEFSQGYSQQWQGDSLLWLRDYYRIYLFDMRTRSFRYDIATRLTNSLMQGFIPSSLSITDRQGGRWEGTMNEGIRYTPARSQRTEIIGGNSPLISQARSFTDHEGNIWHCRLEGLDCEADGVSTHFDMSNVSGLPNNAANFIVEISPDKYLLCVALSQLGYFYPQRKEFVPLNDRLPALSLHRHYTGACVLNGEWVALYSQNGAYLLNTKTDTLASFPCANEIEHFSSKYNCMLSLNEKQASKPQIWVGTQNGLFHLSPKGNEYTCKRIKGLANNCIRSIVSDANKNIWVGTSCGVSCVTPTVINYGSEDGIPSTSMMERAAMLTPDNRLIFVFRAASAVSFRPEWLTDNTDAKTPVFTEVSASNHPIEISTTASETLSLSYDCNTLSFQFSALNYASPSHTRYRHRLLPLEEEWQPTTDSDGSLASLTYRALRPGHYTFQAQAAVGNGAWSEPLSLSFIIRPPLWLTWWAKTIYVLLALMLIMGLMTLYLKKKKARLIEENDERVNRLFELRDQARHQFAESTSIDVEKISANVEEEELVKRMLKAINDNLSNEDYGVDQLARDVAVSRSSLYDRLRTMLGISPAEFLRNVRLKRAAQLLADTRLPVSEVAERVGYGSARIFSQNFKKMFGCLPSDYRAAQPSSN